VSTVLVVDDAVFVRTKNARLLSENGYGVIEASNGQEAVERYSEMLPDLVLMDITMPVLDGIGATRQIKSRFPDARVIMCTALGQQSMVIEALKAGARDFVVKPFEPEKLLMAIKRQLG
jgi:two-component system, chemotaxis family, chemotaxis protein CheY